MAVIYLRHAIHGVKIATLEMEAEADEQNGWERIEPNDPPVPFIRHRSRRRVSEPVKGADLHTDAMGNEQGCNALSIRRKY